MTIETPSKEVLSVIHKRVHDGFTYKTDKRQYGVAEKWVEPYDPTNVTGDCEDFALACRKLCREAGYKTRLVLCKLNDDGHLVLSCGGWIFDNNFDDVKSRDALEHLNGMDYEWLKCSGYEAGDPWHTIEG